MSAPIPPERPTDNPRIARVRRNLAKLKAANAPQEDIDAYLAMEQVTPEEELAQMPRTAMENVRGGLGSALQGATFNFADEIVGAGRAAIDPNLTYREAVADERQQLRDFREANPKTAFGLEMGGGLVGGLGAAKLATTGLKGLSTAGKVAAGGLGGGALGGVGAGETPAGRVGLGLFGGTLGGILGAGAGALAKSRVGDALSRRGRTLLDAIADQSTGQPAMMGQAAREGIEALDPTQTAAVRSLMERMGSATDEAPAKALERLRQIEAAGLGADVMPADVLPAGPRELRRAANISPAGQEMAQQRLGQRASQVGPRARTALTEATGLTPETTAEGVEQLVQQRASRARPLYEQAMQEGAQAASGNPQVAALLQEPDIAAIVGRLQATRQFRDLAPDDPKMLDAIYKALSDREADLSSAMARAASANEPANIGRFGLDDVRAAKQQVLAAMDEVAPSYRTAVSQFAEDSQLRRAYESGVDLFNKPVGDIRVAMQEMKPDELELFKRGVFDALVENRVGRLPNPDLGEVARTAKGYGQTLVDTDAAAQRIRQVFGEDEYNRLLNVAKAEGRFSQTAQEGLQNSSTARQLADMGVFGQFAQDAAENVSPSPTWWAARMARSVARRGQDEWAKRFNEPANRAAVDMLTQQGPEAVTTLLDYLQRMAAADAARTRAVGVGAGAATRPLVNRVP